MNACDVSGYIPYMLVEVKGHLVGVYNLFPSCEFCILNSVY